MVKEMQGNVTDEILGGDPNTTGYLIPPVKAGNIVISPGVKMPPANGTISPANPNNKPYVKPVVRTCPDGFYNAGGVCWPG
jgi:hypothetical protein